jgi:hypothetical protein
MLSDMRSDTSDTSDTNGCYRAEFDLPVSIDRSFFDDDEYYGVYIGVYIISDEGKTSLSSYGYVTFKDLMDVECYKDVLHLSSVVPKIFDGVSDICVSYCSNNNCSRSRRDVIVRSVMVDYEIKTVRKALEKASNEKSYIADLFDDITTDGKRVADAVKGYYDKLKVKEGSVLNGDSVYDGKSFVADVLHDDATNDVDDGYHTNDDVSVKTSSTSGRRRSIHFTDNEDSMLPREYSRKPLDTKKLKLLSESVWSPAGKLNERTYDKKEVKEHHHGAVRRYDRVDTKDLKLGLYEKRDFEDSCYVRGYGGKVKGTKTTPTKGFMIPTVKETERLRQRRNTVDFRDELRDHYVKRIESKEVVSKKEILKGSRNGMVGIKRKKIVEEKKGWKRLGKGVGGL